VLLNHTQVTRAGVLRNRAVGGIIVNVDEGANNRSRTDHFVFLPFLLAL